MGTLGTMLYKWENKAFDFADNILVIGTYKMHQQEYFHRTIMVVQTLRNNVSDIEQMFPYGNIGHAVFLLSFLYKCMEKR